MALDGVSGHAPRGQIFLSIVGMALSWAAYRRMTPWRK
jgi:hypothetical protein